jgi:hypothetical protein
MNADIRSKLKEIRSILDNIDYWDMRVEQESVRPPEFHAMYTMPLDFFVLNRDAQMKSLQYKFNELFDKKQGILYETSNHNRTHSY